MLKGCWYLELCLFEYSNIYPNNLLYYISRIRNFLVSEYSISNGHSKISKFRVFENQELFE